jgi:hypothetical protein
VHKRGIGSHTKPNQGITNTWLTPASLVNALGVFDLDPCAAPSPRPWPTALTHIELPEDGLAASWYGSRCRDCGLMFEQHDSSPCGPDNFHPIPLRIFLNPPYGKEADRWLAKMATHRSGIALTFARTETATWHKWIWPCAHSILFLEGRLYFHKPDGTRGDSNAGGPSALISYSVEDTLALIGSGLKGAHVTWLVRR